MADAFIALPGGCGTIEELMEVFTWRQLGLIAKPIALLNTIGFWTPLIDMVERCIKQGFMKASHEQLWHVAETPQQVLEELEREIETGIVPAESKY